MADSTRMESQGTETSTRQKITSSKQELEAKKKEILAVEKAAAEARKQHKDQEFADQKKKQIELEEELKKLKEQYQKELADANKEQLKKAYSEAGQKLTSALMSGVSDLKSTLDTTMNSFIEKQESMAYGLTGTATDLKTVTQTFTKALGATGVVKQEAVYTKLSELISKGIVFNAEQRAYLGTIAEDLGMVFDPTEGSLTRLINLQRQDLSDERMAIEYSLKEFLNQNYQTSQYIKEGFTSVSNALVEAQSLMSSSTAMEFEAAVQQWLGSMSSVGASTEAINSLATAIGQLSSGDLSVLSSDQFPLLAMAANNAGLSLGDILENGLTSATADALLQGVAQYASSIYSSSSSNVVLSELGKAFGISNVSDLVALSQVGDVTSGGIIGSDISVLLNNMDDYLYTTTKINNSLANFMYSWATDVASSDTNYLVYKVTDVLSQAVSSIFGGVSLEASIPLIGGVSLNLGEIISAVPLLTTIPGLISSISGLGKAFTSSGSANSIYEALASGALAGTTQKIGVAGLFTGSSKTSGASTSGSMVYFNSDTSDISTSASLSSIENASQVYTGTEETKSLDDVYELLEGFKTTSFGTYTHIAESDNTVTIGNDMSLIQDMITASALNISNIYTLLLNYFGSSTAADHQTYDLSQIQWSNEATPFGWTATAGS